MKPFAFDANAIHAFQKERLEGREAEAHCAINKIFAKDCIALDEGGHCLQEWIDCAGGKFPFALTAWVSDQLLMGTIRQYAVGKINIRNDLREQGLPDKDHKWVKLALACEGKVLITNDIDFFDPSAKYHSEAKKSAIRENGGRCSKYLKKKHGIDVYCMKIFAAAA